MKRETLLARLFRALTDKSQEKMAEALGIDRSHLVHIEMGRASPGEHLERLAHEAELTLADGDELLEVAENQRRSRKWHGPGLGDLLAELTVRQRAQVERAFRHLLTLPQPEATPRPEDRPKAAALWQQIKEFSEAALLVVIQAEEELQTWALCELLCEASVREATRDLGRAAAFARVARAIAELVRGPEGWLRRLMAFAVAHCANILRVQGDLKAAAAELEEAKRLWKAGSDPGCILDPGRLLNLEASLRRDQRRFADALACLEEELVVGRSPERALINMGFTLEVMGDYERAIATLLQAESLVDRQTEPREWYNLHFNLAVNYCHLGAYSQSAALAVEVREIAADLGDAIFMLRVTWLQGRIAAGKGFCEEALKLLQEARLGFGAHKKSYDVALALLEEAALLLDEGRHAEVKALTPELAQVFETKGVHREALAALRLFLEAAEREEATAELARSVLRYLFRARYDQELSFKAS